MVAERDVLKDYHGKVLSIDFGGDSRPLPAWAEEDIDPVPSALEQETNYLNQYPDLGLKVRSIDGELRYFQQRDSYHVPLTQDQAHDITHAFDIYQRLSQSGRMDDQDDAREIADKFFPSLTEYAEVIREENEFLTASDDDFMQIFGGGYHPRAIRGYEPDPAPDFNPETDL